MSDTPNQFATPGPEGQANYVSDRQAKLPRNNHPDMQSIGDEIFDESAYKPVQLSLSIPGKLSMENYKMLSVKKLGAGTFGVTCKVEMKGGESQNIDMVVKVVRDDVVQDFRDDVVVEQYCIIATRGSAYTPGFPSEVELPANISNPFQAIMTLEEVGPPNQLVVIGAEVVIMDFKEGEKYSEHMNREYHPGTDLAAGDYVRNIGVGIGTGIRDCNRQGINHLDLKFGNIYVGEDGKPIILDFGLVAVSVQGQLITNFDDNQDLIGTPGYIMPRLIWANNDQTDQSERKDPLLYEKASTWSVYNLMFNELLFYYPYYIDSNQTVVSYLHFMGSANQVEYAEHCKNNPGKQGAGTVISLKSLVEAHISRRNLRLFDKYQEPELAMAFTFGYLKYHMDMINNEEFELGDTAGLDNQLVQSYEDGARAAEALAAGMTPTPDIAMRELSVRLNTFPKK